MLPSPRVKDMKLEARPRPPFKRPLAYINRQELEFLYKEIVVDQCYMHTSHGIAVNIREGDVVVDVGANIGLFSLFASHRAGPGGCVIAIEASPVICDVLKFNLSDLRSQGQSKTLVVNRAVSGSNRESSSFTFYPRATGWSSLDPVDNEERSNMEGFLEMEMKGTDEASTPLLGAARTLFRRVGTGFVYEWLRDRAIDYMLEGKILQKVECETLESICNKIGVSRIDYLKIDCERAEFEVLAGIGASQWEEIGTIVMEVHDYDLQGEEGGTSLERVKRLLESHDFLVNVEQPLSKTNLYMIYAKK